MPSNFDNNRHISTQCRLYFCRLDFQIQNLASWNDGRAQKIRFQENRRTIAHLATPVGARIHKNQTKANFRHSPTDGPQQTKYKTKPNELTYSIENTRTPSRTATNFITFHHFH